MEGSSSTTSKCARAIAKKASTHTGSPPLQSETARSSERSEPEVCYGGCPEMTQASGQQPTAQGSLERTPLVHLLVYMADRQVSGSLVLADPDTFFKPQTDETDPAFTADLDEKLPLVDDDDAEPTVSPNLS